jgi:hypothetical protein
MNILLLRWRQNLFYCTVWHDVRNKPTSVWWKLEPPHNDIQHRTTYFIIILCWYSAVNNKRRANDYCCPSSARNTMTDMNASYRTRLMISSEATFLTSPAVMREAPWKFLFFISSWNRLLSCVFILQFMYPVFHVAFIQLKARSNLSRHYVFTPRVRLIYLFICGLFNDVVSNSD